jgi:hypothetical protein
MINGRMEVDDGIDGDADDAAICVTNEELLTQKCVLLCPSA